MAYEGGFTSATNDASTRQSQDVYRQLAMQQAQQQAIAFAASQAAAQRQQQARGPAFDMLARTMGGQVPPPPGMGPQPGTPQGGPQPQPPGTSSQPAAQMGPPPPSPGAGGAAGPSIPPPPGAGGGMQQPQAGMPPPIPPFKSMPTAPPPQPMGGGIPPPPQAGGAPPAEGQETTPRWQGSLSSVIQNLDKMGVPSSVKMDMLDEMRPILNEAQQQELGFYKAQTNALKVTEQFYKDQLALNIRQQEADTKKRESERKTDQGDRRLDQGQQKIDLKAKAGAAAGGSANLKTSELIYPKGADGRPDETQAPIGVRGITKTGKIITLDAEGNRTNGPLDGGSAKEAKDTKGSQAQNVRTGLVKSGVTNSLARLSEIEEQFPNTNTSAFFGAHADNPVSKSAYGVGRGMQSSDQKKADAQWASLIDEAIPVFTGGLRGSDAFRRFLIDQAPGPGDDAASRKEKIRLLRANINGTSKAFFNKFASDPTMHAAGTKPEDIEAAKGGGGPGAPAPGTVQDGYKFKGGDPAKRESWEKV